MIAPFVLTSWTRKPRGNGATPARIAGASIRALTPRSIAAAKVFLRIRFSQSVMAAVEP